MTAPQAPKSLRGRIQPALSIEQIRKLIALDRALHPARRTVSADEFEQIVYDAIANDRSMPAVAVVRWAERTLEVVG